MYSTSIVIVIETIILSPMSMTVCRTQTTRVEFSCAIARGGVNITAIDWQILVEGEYQSVQGMPRHVTHSAISGDTIFGTLRVTGVIMDDDGNQYRCSPTDATVVSDIAILTVLGKDVIKGACGFYEATQMTNIIILSSAYEKNLDLTIRNEL